MTRYSAPLLIAAMYFMTLPAPRSPMNHRSAEFPDP
jgi:hypothetical protein